MYLKKSAIIGRDVEVLRAYICLSLGGREDSYPLHVIIAELEWDTCPHVQILPHGGIQRLLDFFRFHSHLGLRAPGGSAGTTQAATSPNGSATCQPLSGGACGG